MSELQVTLAELRGWLARRLTSAAARLDDGAPSGVQAAAPEPQVDPSPAGHDQVEPTDAEQRVDHAPESEPGHRLAFERALRELGPQAVTVVDVGARWGAEHEWFRLRPLARLVGFDPDPAECAYLNGVSDPVDQCFVPVALGRVDGDSELYVTQEPGCSSMYPPSAAILDRYPSLVPLMTTVDRVTVPVARLETWWAGSDERPFDFIKLDTQGSELDILVGAEALLDQCLGVQVEVEFSPLYDGQHLFADVDSFLRSKGFTLWRLENLAHYTDNPSERLEGRSTSWYEHVGVEHAAGDGRLIWANAVYFRDRQQLGESRRDLLVLAALLEAAGDLDGSSCCLAAADAGTTESA